MALVMMVHLYHGCALKDRRALCSYFGHASALGWWECRHWPV